MHSAAVKQQAMELIEAGVNDCEVARRLGIARTTIRDWRRPTYVPREGSPPRRPCPRCWLPAKPMTFSPEDYCELLGLYLGDGTISDLARTQMLRLFFDAKYPGLIANARLLLDRCMPHNRNNVHTPSDANMIVLSIYSRHLGCLFPQCGPGLKHRRPIALEPWQLELVHAAPLPFLRGCINSDGCVFVNRTGAYEYLSYCFTNRSKDIVDLFTSACEELGIRYRATQHPRRGVWHVRINRRECVAKLLPHVPRKA